MNKTTITLHEEQETLLIPLYSKAQPNPILVDPDAQKILASVNYNFSSLHVPEKTTVNLLLRALKLDVAAREFADAYPDCLILHLGCGLDSRCHRIGQFQGDWFDLDYPAVIDLRKKFFPESSNYHQIPSSVTDLRWIDQISLTQRPTLIIAEGLLMYLHEEEVKDLLLALRKRFPGAQIIFDAFSKYTTDRIQAHPSLNKTGAQIHWGIDDASDIETWASGIQLLEEWFFSQSFAIPKLKPYYRFMFRFADKIEMARKAHRILHYQL